MSEKWPCAVTERRFILTAGLFQTVASPKKIPLFVLIFKVLVQPKRNIWSSFINRVPKPRRISFFLGTYKEKDSSLRRSFPYNEKVVLTTRRCNLLNMYAKFGPSSCQFYRRGNVVHFDMDVVCP